MKKIFTIINAIILTIGVFAQSPEKMSYQAIVRNASNTLVTSHAVGMRISILQTSATGTAVYVETQTPTTNANGLVSIEIGGGTVVSGSFSTINWSNGIYFIKTEIDPTGGASYTITGTSQLLSVPYALYAKTSNYNQLTNKPTLATVATSGNYSDLTGKPTLANVASSGSYSDLTNRPDFTKWDKDSTDNVTLTGNQTIAGTKTFSGTVNADSLFLTKKVTKYDFNPSSFQNLSSSSPFTITNVGNFITISSSSISTRTIGMGIDIPSQILGCAQNIKSVTIYYKCTSANVSITDLRLRKGRGESESDFGGGTVNLNSTSATSYSFYVGGNFINTKLNLYVTINFAAATASDNLNISDVVVETY